MILAPLLLALAQQAPPAPETHVRPRDPFVFRCVLDKRARMLVAALDEDMWVAWDTTNGGLVKAWKGGVNFDGAVYTTVHGPQPTSRGAEYTTGVGDTPWIAYVDGKPVPAQASYLGYNLANGGVVLEWKIKFGADREVVVREKPEFDHLGQWLDADALRALGPHSGEQPSLTRSFEAVGLREKESVNILFRHDDVAFLLAEQEHARREEVKDERGQVIATHEVSELPLRATAPRQPLILAFHPIVLPPKEEEKK